MVFFAGQLLEKATQDTARLIFTGQVQQSSMTAAQFRQTLCSELLAMLDCANVTIDVKNFPSFAAIDVTPPISNGNFVNNPAFLPGGPGDIVIVRVFYPWQLFVPTMGLNLANLNGNKRLLTATAAFRNEPF
jgi:Flp pilus assembly protein TadG